MKLAVKMFLVLSFLSGLGSLFAQKIIKVVPKFVLIDTDQGIGKLGDEINVYRNTEEGPIKIGKVQIVKFAEGKTGAKIVWIEPGLSVSVGDIVQNEEEFSSTDFYFDDVDESPIEQEERIPMPPSRLAIGIGQFVPAQNLDRFLASGFCISASLRFAQLGPHHFFIDLSYPILKVKSSMSGVSSPSLWSFHIGDHIRMRNRIYYDVGVGVYNSKLPDPGRSSQGASSSSKTGFLLGLSIDLQGLSSTTVVPFVRCHMFQTDPEWQVYATAGVTFHFAFLNF